MENIKSLDKKYLFVIGAIFGGIFLLIIFVALFRACSGPSNNYEGTEKKMVSAAKGYFNSDGKEEPKEFESKEVSAKELASSGNMKDLTEYLEDTSCTGKVVVYNHGGQMLYVPNLECSEYKTKHLSDKIINDNLVENPEDPYTSGLYLMDTNYVFRGKDPNNYLSFGGLMWRILDINEEGIIRIIRIETEDRPIYWDTKFNSEINKSYGINDYEHSFILENLNADYKSFKDSSKLHMSPHDVCIGRRGSKDLGIDYNIDCSEILENQYMSIISSSDYSRPSLDTNCNKVTAGACYNYNYMTSVTTDTWTTTAMNKNTYDVVYISGGMASSMYARKSTTYNRVVAIQGYEKYISGDGTVKSPYIVGNNDK